jgi:hypothetical protein
VPSIRPPIKDDTWARPVARASEAAQNQAVLEVQMSRPPAPDVSFWRDFDFRTPRVFKRFSPAPIVSSEDALASLRAIAAQCVEPGPKRKYAYRFFKLYLGMRAVIDDREPYLPNATDRSLREMCDRVCRESGSTSMGCNMVLYQFHDFASWLRIRRFVASQYPVTGMPVRKTGCELFFGNYRCTPNGGIHRDDGNIFHFVVEGHKRILLWKEDVFPEFKHVQQIETGLMDVDRYRDRAIVLEGDPGDMLYWPAEYFHVGDNDGQFCLSLTIAMLTEVTPFLMLTGMPPSALGDLSRRLPDFIGTDFHDPQAAAAAFPKEMLAAAEALRSPPTLERFLRVSWLSRVSANGFIQIPPPRSGPPLRDGDVVQGSPEFPILSLVFDPGTRTIAAHGLDLTVPDDRWVELLITRLNTGAPASTSALLDEVAPRDTEGRGRARGLLDSLWTMRAIEKMP